MAFPSTWGTTREETRAGFPCDALPAGDLVMMRRQLLTLKVLSERHLEPA